MGSMHHSQAITHNKNLRWPGIAQVLSSHCLDYKFLQKWEFCKNLRSDDFYLGSRTSVSSNHLCCIWPTVTIIWFNFVLFSFRSGSKIESRIKLLKTFFLDSIFEPLYFLKLGPIFVGPTLCQITKYSNFIWLLLIFVQKPCFLGPIKQETPWRNWH